MTAGQREHNGIDNQVQETIFTIVQSPQDLQTSPVPNGTNESEKRHDFEEAVEATGYGLFNYLLLLAMLPVGMTSFFDTTTMSYVLPSAECDLNLTLFDKGLLNGATYAGMIASAFVWGFISDTRGRRPSLIFGYSADFICNALSSTSQSFYVTLAFKFISGCLVSGPVVISMAFFAEFHGKKHRARTFVWARLAPCIANVLLPGLAWLIIPQPWSFTLSDGAFVYNSWRIFILICATVPLLALISLMFLPESPKFLMSQGHNDEAMKVFQMMYALNTGNPPETFPVKLLCEEGQRRQKERSDRRQGMSIWDKTRNDWDQIKPLFRKPYLYKFLLLTTIQFGGLLSLTTLRLWSPQLFTLIENFDFESHDPSLGTPTLCVMLGLQTSSNVTNLDTDTNLTIIETCVVTPVRSKVYTNSMIIAGTAVLSYLVAGNVIDLVGGKKLLLMSYAVAAACSLSLNWSPNPEAVLAILAIYMGFISITITVMMSVIVEVMPTTLRTTAASLALCIDRCGALLGNIIFPVLLSVGCIVPFISIGGFLLGCFALSIIIPKPPPKLM